MPFTTFSVAEAGLNIHIPFPSQPEVAQQNIPTLDYLQTWPPLPQWKV